MLCGNKGCERPTVRLHRAGDGLWVCDDCWQAPPSRMALFVTYADHKMQVSATNAHVADIRSRRLAWEDQKSVYRHKEKTHFF